MDNASELVLYAINDGHIYESLTVPTIALLKKKHAKGIFTKDKALICYKRIADYAAKRYYAEISPNGFIAKFSVDDRKQAANELYDYYLDEVVS